MQRELVNHLTFGTHLFCSEEAHLEAGLQKFSGFRQLKRLTKAAKLEGQEEVQIVIIELCHAGAEPELMRLAICDLRRDHTFGGEVISTSNAWYLYLASLGHKRNCYLAQASLGSEWHHENCFEPEQIRI
eukprot:s3009_g4.t1